MNLSRNINQSDPCGASKGEPKPDSEIRFERPKSIVFISVVNLMIAATPTLFLWFLHILAEGIGGTTRMDARQNLLWRSVIFGSPGVIYLLTAWGLMSAREWARALNAVLSLMALFLVSFWFTMGGNSQVFIMVRPYLMIIFAVFCYVGFIPYIGRKPRRWFKIARCIRSERGGKIA